MGLDKCTSTSIKIGTYVTVVNHLQVSDLYIKSKETTILRTRLFSGNHEPFLIDKLGFLSHLNDVQMVVPVLADSPASSLVLSVALPTQAVDSDNTQVVPKRIEQ